MQYEGHFDRTPKSGALRKVLIAVVCVILVLAGIVTAGYLYLGSKLNKISQAQLDVKDTTGLDLSELIGNVDGIDPSLSTPEATSPQDSQNADLGTTSNISTPEATSPQDSQNADLGTTSNIINILVVGQDYREDEGHKLADSIILFTMNKETRTLTLTSFLRDSYVDLVDRNGSVCGRNRINTSYALGFAWYGDLGAMEMINQTIEYNYGVHIDGNIEVGFDTFEKTVDVLGGVELDLQGDELSYMNDISVKYGTEPFHEGINLVNGQEALWYARMRHSNAADSDFKRAARQRIVIDKILSKLKSKSLLELNSLLDEVLPMVLTNISEEDMKTYITELLPYVFDLKIASNQCPAEGSYSGVIIDIAGVPSAVLKIDFNKNKEILREICLDPEDTPVSENAS